MKRMILLLTVLLAFLLCGCEETITIGEREYVLTVTELDLSGGPLPSQEELAGLTQLAELEMLNLRDTGLTIDRYEDLRALLPGCEILWQVPLGSGFAEPDTQSLTLETLTEADVAAMAYLDLQELQLLSQPDRELLEAVREAVPDCEVRWQVMLGDACIPSDAVLLEVYPAQIPELLEILPALPAVAEISFLENPAKGDMAELVETYPDIRFLWEFDLFGRTVSSETTELDLSGIPMESPEEVEESLKYFNGLETLILCDCGLPSEELDALWKRHPETRVIWNVRVGKMKLRTDITALMPFQYGYTGANGDLTDADCGEMKYLVDMVCLDLGHMSVRDLSFLQYMPDIEYLLLCENGIRDISPLAGLQKLKYLELFANGITDISALAECPALEDLNITYNRVGDVSPLFGLENLKHLHITGVLLEPEQLRLLEENLSHIDQLMTLGGPSTGNGWRDLPNYFAQRDLLGAGYMKTHGTN